MFDNDMHSGVAKEYFVEGVETSKKDLIDKLRISKSSLEKYTRKTKSVIIKDIKIEIKNKYIVNGALYNISKDGKKIRNLTIHQVMKKLDKAKQQIDRFVENGNYTKDGWCVELVGGEL